MLLKMLPVQRLGPLDWIEMKHAVSQSVSQSVRPGQSSAPIAHT